MELDQFVSSVECECYIYNIWLNSLFFKDHKNVPSQAETMCLNLKVLYPFWKLL